MFSSGRINKKVIGSLFVGLIAIFLICSFAQAQSPEVDRGLLWLRSNQNADGRWGNLNGFRDTSATIDAYKMLKISDGSYLNALSWLSSNVVESNDYIARRIISLAGTGADVNSDLQKLNLSQNQDGGWGYLGGYGSNAYDTAMALCAFYSAQSNNLVVIEKALNYLVSKQNVDGSWNFLSDIPGDLVTTSLAILILNQYNSYYVLDNYINKGILWLRGMQNPDGGFGDSPSTVHSTAFALRVFIECGQVQPDILNGAVNYIITKQLSNGSWNESPYETAMAINSLASLKPNLSIVASDLYVSNKTPKSGEVLTIRALIRNSGTKTADNIAVQIFVQSPTNEIIQLGETQVIPTLTAGGSATIEVPFDTKGREGPYYIHVKVDPEGTIDEITKKDNEVSVQISIVAVPDLVISDSGLVLSKYSANIGEDVTISATISNQGNSFARDIEVEYYYDSISQQTLIGKGYIPYLNPGEAASREMIWKTNKVGTDIPVYAVVDPHNKVVELIKDNNQAVKQITIAQVTEPNLTVSYKDITFTPPIANQGGSVTVSAIVKNEGFSQADSVEVVFYKGDPSAGGIVLHSESIPNIPSGSAATISFDWTSISESGERLIFVKVDPNNTIAEYNEEDNVTFTTLKILSLPDFAISTNSITFNPPAPKDGDTVAISVAVQNKGEQGAQNIMVRASEGGTVIGSQVIPSVLGNSQAIANLTYNTTGKSGSHQITVVVDPDNTIVEQSEDNNQASRTFGVQNANLWLTELYISPNGDSVKDSTQFFFRLDNPQTVKISVVNEKGETVRSFSGAEFENTSGGNATWDGKNNNGVVVADGDYQIQILDPNNNNLGSLLVVVDNNQSPFVKAVGTKYLLKQNLTCMLPDLGWDWKWFPDESGILFRIYQSDVNTPEYPSGLYTITPDGEDILRIVPWDWTNNISPQYDYYIQDYALSWDGGKNVFSLLKRKKVAGVSEVSQLWVVDRDGSNLTLLDSYDLSIDRTIIQNVKWSPDQEYIAYLTLKQATSKYELRVIRSNGSGKTIIELDLGDWNLETLKWSPDSSKIAYLYQNKIRVSDVAGAKEDIYESSCGQIEWINYQKLLCASEGGTAWLVDASGAGNHLQLAENLKGYVSIAPNRESVAFKTRVDDTLNLYISGLDGNVQKLHEFQNNEGCYLSSGQITWTNGSKKIATSEGSQLGEGMPCPEQKGYLVIINIDSSETTSFPGTFGNLQWFSDNVSLLDALSAVNSETGEKVSIITETSWSDPQLSPLERYITYNQFVDPSSICYGRGYRDLWAISSLLNLTADLKLKKERSSIILKGSAVDLNFEGYVLEYADTKSPTVWNLVAPASDISIIDDVFTTWVPPYEGIFYVRLTVWDKAGNVAQDIKRASWGLSSSITNLYKSLEYFSPNGDGVKDTVELHYTVLEPVHLEFNIYDENNNLKRTFLKDYSTTVSDFITWDGRDEGGRVVSDGKYKIKVFDYDFFVRIDNTPPDVNITMTSIHRNLNIFNRRTYDPNLHVHLLGHAFDNNFKRWFIEYGEGDDPQEWNELMEGTDLLAQRDDEGILIPNTDATLKKYYPKEIPGYVEGILPLVGKRFKITAEDFAGNKSTIVSDFLEERIILYLWDLIDMVTGSIRKDLAGPGIHSLGGFETIRLPIASLNLQYWMDGKWIDASPITSPSSAEINMEWDSSVVHEYIVVRLKAVDTVGREFYSDWLGSTLFGIYVMCYSDSPLGAINLLPEDLRLLKLQILGVDDASFSQWTDYKVYDALHGDTIPKGQFFPPPPPVQSGRMYKLRMIGVGFSEQIYISGEVNYPGDCFYGWEGPKLTPIIENDSEACGSISNKATISSQVKNLYDVSFETLTYFIEEPGGRRVLGQFDLKKEGWGSVKVDTSTMAEGNYPIYITLEYHGLNDNITQEISGLSELVVDRVLPTSRITYPSASLRVCPIVVSDETGNWMGIPVEGIAADNTRVNRYDLYTGSGENPSEWFPADTRRYNYSKEMVESVPISGYGPITGKIGTLEITPGKSGTFSLMLKVTDISGNVSCDTTSFSFDNSVDITHLGVDKTLFSPNGDGALDDLNISYEIDEYARVDIKVFRLLWNEKDKIYSLDSTPIRTIISGKQYLSGTETILWDGKDDFGATVLDELYGIAVFAIDSCGNTNLKWVPVEVDNTLPTTVITYPQPNDPIGNIVEVKGTADDLHFQSYLLEAGQGDNPETWNLVSSDTKPANNGIIGRWNTFGLEGTWTLRLSATDTVGNKNETTVSIDLGERKTLIKDLSTNPRLFSPNNDGKLDTTRIDYEVTDACDMTIEIFDSGDIARKTYTTVTPSAGIYTYTWDGRDNAGAMVPDGIYEVRLTAALSSSPSVTQNETVTIVADSTLPFMDIKQPLNNSYFKDNNITVNGTINDVNMKEYLVAYAGDSGTGTIDQGNQNRVNYTFGIVNDLPEGNYTLAVKAKDLAENYVEQTIAFVVDRTPPKVSLDTPKEGEYYGSDKNTIAVTGSIVEKNLDTYTLRYGSGDNPTQWTDLLTGNVVPTNPQLFTWKVGKNDGIPDGLYTLSLFAKDKAELIGETKVKVTVDNTPPETAITSPADGGYVKAAIDIIGTAFDQNLEKYIFEISEGQCTSAYKWAAIKTSTTSVRSGVIAPWHSLPPDGDYCLRVTAADKIGNKSEAKVNVKVDTQPPASPVLSGNIENKSNARLTWTANSEPDFSGYNLYRDAKKVNAGLINDINYLDQSLKEGIYAYILTAVDLAGNESKPSNQIKLTVDTTPPNARINSPQDSSWVSSLVDIKGTAYSTDDFKEYRVSIGQGSVPSAWNLIRTSPLSTSYGSLAPWDTIGLPEGIYSIKLEAEDLTGNINTHQVSVNLDNTPPGAPVLLTGTATGSDVTLTWQANPEADMTGYLLYRNDQLANVSGIVIGNLKPYLIVGTTYLNKAVPDGKSKYYLIAMDLAGNMSDPSNTLEVDIDTRPPHATIVEPTDKGKFQDKTFVRAESPDTDIASVQFQYKRAQDTAWINLNSPVTDSPYGTYLDPAILGFTHGDYHLRAIATDLGAKTDPSPSFITVTYTDLTTPEVPKDLAALTSGSDITLTWTANTEADLDGYNIYRTSDGSKIKINSSVVKVTHYQDNGLADGEYTYEITAIDTFGNESKPSNTALTKVYAPLVQQPYTPVGENVLEIHGSNATASASVEITIEPVSGSVLRVTTPADAAGNFNINNVPLILGENRITAKATDNTGNISRTSDTAVVVYNEPPSAPTGLTTSVNGNDVALTWSPNTESDLSGYNLYRDGELVNSPIPITPQQGTTSASNYSAYASRAFDSNPGTYWYAYGYGSPVWWEVDLSSPELINHVEIHWGSRIDPQGNEILYAGKDYEIQVWSGYAWITQTKVAGNSAKDNTFDYKPSYRTDKIRIYITQSTDPISSKQIRISEVGVSKDVLISQASFSDNPGDGVHHYKVSAVDYYGFESTPSEEAGAEVGDVTAPSAPQNLTATSSGSDIILTWSPNSETDLAGYNIYRNTPQGWVKINLGLITGAAYTDPNLLNGTYTYRITAVDAVGNESLPSNEATATVQDLIPPSKPEIFFPTSSGVPITLSKDKTDISGIADPGSTVALYKNGILTASTMALTSDQTVSFNGDFFGSASPDGRVLAYGDADGFVSLQTLATGDKKQIAQGYYPQWSPNGEKLSYLFDDNNGNYRIGIYDVTKGNSVAFNGGTLTSNEYDSSWCFDGNKIAYLSDRGGTPDAWLLDLSSGLMIQVTSGLNLYTLRLSPDSKKLAYSDEHNIFVNDLINGNTIQEDTNADPWYFEWSPDSKRLAFASFRNGNADIFMLDMETNAQIQITDSANDEMYPSWSPDGWSIVYQKIDPSGNNFIEIASLQTLGQQRLLKENLSSLYYLSWLRSGKIAYTDPMGLNMISLSGYFSFGDVSLDSGENVFYATATDTAGNVSLSSDEIYVSFSPQLPDLEITPEDIFIYPATPIVGEEVAITVIYRNKGQIEAKDIDLKIYLWDSKGNVNLLKSENIPSIEPGSEEWIDLSLNTTGMAGTNQIIAVIDPENRIAEALENNNDAIREFFVATQEGLFMTTTLDSTQYHSKQDVNIVVNLKNSGVEKAVTLEVWIEDENGFTVALADTTHENLPYASDNDYGVIWNTGLTFSGSYRVHTILKEGTIVWAENTVPFTILPDTNVQTTVVTDKAAYYPNENVVITITVRNGGENAPIPELKTITRILDAVGQELFKEEDEIKNLLPGGISSLNLTWNTGLHPVGDYSVITEAYLNNQLVTSKSALFRIDTSLIVTGSLHVNPTIILVGNTGQAEYVLKNEGNVDMNGLLVRLMIVDPEAQITLATQEETIDLTIGASRNGTWAFSTEGYSLKTYVLILQSIYQSDTKPIANASFSVKGGTPHISVSAQSLDFGSINLGDTSSQTITISNSGNADLVIGIIALSGTNQGEFSLQNDNCSGRPIAPSTNCTLDILFSPTSPGVKSASLFIPSNAIDTPSLYLSLCGTGITNLNVSINPNGTGRVTGTGIDCPGDCTENFSTSGASIQLTATPSEGYQFVNWTGDINLTDNPVTLNMDTHKNVTANFTLKTYTINAIAGPGGIISPSGQITVNYGASQPFTIIPDAGYLIAEVKVDGYSRGAISSYTFTNVTSDHTIEASFVINQYAIIATVGSGGTITPSGSVTVSYGGSQTFTITPDAGYRISDVEVDGAMLGVTSSYTFNNVNSNHTISATFKGIQVVSLPFSDNFDDDIAGTQPDLPWDNFNGGTAIVTNTESHSPANSISVSSGPEGNGSAFVNLGETYPDRIAYEVWTKVNSTGSSAYIGFSEEILGFIPQFNAVYFNGSDGKVYFFSDDSNYGFMVPLLDNFTLGVWHKVHVEIDFANLVADIFIDDIQVGSNLPVSPKGAIWDYQGTYSFQLNKIGVTHDLGEPFYFDDFSVFEWNPYTPVDLLRSAGPGQWAVLGMGGIGSANNTNISMSGSSSVKGTVAHMGVANAGNVNMSGSSLINGTLSLNTAGRLNKSGTSTVVGGVVQNAATDAVLDQAVADALSASQSAASLPATITSVTNIMISNPSQNITITGGAEINVLHLTKINISNGTLTLTAPQGGSFIINISGNFNLSGGSRIVLAGGITPSDVLYNIVGSGGNVSMSGGSAVSGILLAPERGISNSTGVVTGEVIGGGSQISSSGTGQVNNPGP